MLSNDQFHWSTNKMIENAEAGADERKLRKLEVVLHAKFRLLCVERILCDG